MFPARLKARLKASVASRGPHQYRFRPVSRLQARFKSPGTRRGPEEPCFHRFRPVSKLQGPAVGPKNQKVFPEPGPRFIMLSSVMSAESQSPVGTGGPACKCVAEFTRPAPWSGGCGCRGHCGFAVSECEHGRQTRQRCLWCDRYFV